MKNLERKKKNEPETQGPKEFHIQVTGVTKGKHEKGHKKCFRNNG